MISVEKLFKRVNNDLARKNAAGYTNSDEFTRDLTDSENILYEYYYKQYEQTQKIADSIDVFLPEKMLSIADESYVGKPSDYRHYSSMTYRKVDGEDCDNPVVKRVPIIKLKAHEFDSFVDSYINAPSLEKGAVYCTQKNNKFKLAPELKGSVYFKYFRHPIYGKYASKIDLVKKIEVYDEENSIDLEWNLQEETNLINLLLLHKGITIREDDLIRYAMGQIQKEAA